MGCYIVEFEQNGEDRAAYGEQLLKKLEGICHEGCMFLVLIIHFFEYMYTEQSVFKDIQ